MNSKFNCKSCKRIFESDGNKVEWKDPIYGPCFKYVAACPVCQKECSEYQAPKNQTSDSSSGSHNSGCGCCSMANSCGMN